MRALLFDLDGVLYQGDRIIDPAPSLPQRIRLGRTKHERSEILCAQQTKLTPARIQPRSLAGRDARDALLKEIAQDSQ